MKRRGKAGGAVREAIVLGIVLVLLAACSASTDSGNDWLLGQWELAYNPENDDEDVLLFHEDGRVVIQTVDGREINGRYRIANDHLYLTLMLANRPLEVNFAISPDHSRLIFEKTGAYYQHSP